MSYIGIDVHSKWSTFVALDPTTAEVVTFDRMSNTAQDIADRLGSLSGSFVYLPPLVIDRADW